MTTQTQIRKRDSKGRFAPEQATVEPKVDPEAQAKVAAMDELLDEIDAVLEENAQEFVAGYVQKGGE